MSDAGITRAQQPSPCRLPFESGEWRTTGIAGISSPPIRRITLLVGASIAAIALAGGRVAEEEEGGERNLPIEFVHNNLEEAPVAGAVWAAGPASRTATPICSTPTQNGANVNTELRGHRPAQRDVDRGQPHRPRQHDRGANDYQLAINPGGHVSRHDALAGARLVRRRPDAGPYTRSGPNATYQATGDPAVAFDAAGNAYYATLGFRFVGPANAQNPDILVSDSRRRRHDLDSHRVAQGSGVGTWSATCSTRSTSRRGATATRSSPSATSGWATRARFSRPGSTPR